LNQWQNQPQQPYGTPQQPYAQPAAAMQQVPAPGAMQAWGETTYIARRNFFNFLGIKCRIMRLDGSLMFFVHQKAFKLKEDITVFADEQQSTPLLSIKARQIIDFSACYDVVDLSNGQHVGVLQRQGLKSMLRDEWTVMNPMQQPIATIQEDSMALALIRRFLSNLVPQSYTISTGMNNPIGEMKGTWNPFLVKYTVDFSRDHQQHLDRRLALASVVLLMCIEGKQG